jgi:hypothetical protein
MKHRDSRRPRVVPVVEPLERRTFLDGTQETITITISENQGVSFVENAHEHVDIDFKHCSGTVTVTGTDLVQTTVKGGGVVVTGTVNYLNAVDVTASSNPAVADVLVDGIGFGNDDVDWMELQDFVDSVTLNTVEIQDVNLTDMIQIDQADFVKMDVAHNIRMNADVVKSLSIGSVLDSQIVLTGPLTQFVANSFIASTPGSASLTGYPIASIKIGGAFTADLNLNYQLAPKFTVDTFHIGGNASGTWDIEGTTHSIYADSFDSAFSGTFGRVDNWGVRASYSGAFSAGSVANMSVGGNINNGTLNFTNAYSLNVLDLGKLTVGNYITGSNITSAGNIGSVHTMYTYYSYIDAGTSSGYVFGNTPTSADYTSPCYIESFYSDCPSMHNLHFESSEVAAFNLENVHIGNVVTDNGGSPFGLVGIRMEAVMVGVGGKQLRFKNLMTEADFTTGLTSQRQSQQTLGDLVILLPIQIIQPPTD